MRPSNSATAAQEQVVRRYAFTTKGQDREVSLLKKGESFQVYVDERYVSAAEADLQNLLLPLEIPMLGGPPLQAFISQYVLCVNDVPVEPWWTLEHGDNLDLPPTEVVNFQPNKPLEVSPKTSIRMPEQVLPVAQAGQSAQTGAPLRESMHRASVLREPMRLDSPFSAPSLALKAAPGSGNNADDADLSAFNHKIQQARDRSWHSSEADMQQVATFQHPRLTTKSSSWFACCSVQTGGSPRPRTPPKANTMTHEDEACVCCRPSNVGENRQIARMCHTECNALGQEVFKGT